MHSIPNGVEFRADLHCHSTKSDGVLTPIQLIDLAKASSLQGLSITDHDSVDGYAEALPYAKKQGIDLRVGVELSCSLGGKSVHILGYDFLLSNIALQSYLKRLQERRMDRNREILAKLARLRFPVSEKELMENYPNISSIGRPHIAALLVKKGFVGSIQEAFCRYLGDGRCCFAPGKVFPVREGIEIVQKAGGKVFIAHPHLYRDVHFVEKLVSMGFDGIECYYARFTFDQIKQWLALAKKHGVLISGGSDFHGIYKDSGFLGSSYVLFEQFKEIFSSGHV